MQLLRDIAVAVAIVLSAFSLYDTRIKPVYVCDINAIIKEYTATLKKTKLSYFEKQRRLEEFMYVLKSILSKYGTVYSKGVVVGRNVKDITQEVKDEISRYIYISTN